MMKIILFAFAILGVIVIWNKQLQAQLSPITIPGDRGLVVVELFTSQSCSSCPAADRLLGNISDSDNVITLGFHVDYWDHLHWKDTFSRNFSTRRQRSYAAYKNSNRVYTPQIIVNGQTAFVGSRAGDLKSALNTATPVKRITISKNDQGQIIYNLPDISTSKPITLRVFGIADAQKISIPSGENRGRSIDYSSPVITQTQLADWNGDSETNSLRINEDENQKIDKIVVLAQENGFGPIVAAGEYKL